MTNERFTAPTTTITINDVEYFIAALPTDDRACLRLMIELQRDLSTYLLAAANHDLDPESRFSIDAESPLTQFDYSADHDDYNFAAAHLLALTTAALIAHIHETARDALIELITTDTFCFDAITLSADLTTPFLDLITDDLDD